MGSPVEEAWVCWCVLERSWAWAGSSGLTAMPMAAGGSWPRLPHLRAEGEALLLRGL